MTEFSVRDEYAPKFGRQRLTLWSGAFASSFAGWAVELPGHDGFMVELDYSRGKKRVTCEAPRDDDNWQRVDKAINEAAKEIEAAYEASLPRYVYEVQGHYGFGWEMVTTEDTREAAEEQKRVYDENESEPHRVRRVRV